MARRLSSETAAKGVAKRYVLLNDRLMNEPSIWIVAAEVKPLDGADAPKWCVGAYVECCVQAADIVYAVERVRSVLESEHYEVADISQALRYHADDFEDGEPIHSLAAEAHEAMGAVVYGPFEGWAADGVPASEVGEA